jgi:GAF domain-containing protein
LPGDNGGAELPLRAGVRALASVDGRPRRATRWATLDGMRLDPTRLAELNRLLILDSGPERAYDDITRLLASSLAVPITMVNLLDAERDWFKSCVGVQQTQSPAVTSFCEAFFNTSQDLIVVEDTLNDPRFEQHPKVVGRPFIRFYAAARLAVRGRTVGTLCAYDVSPRQLAPAQLDALQTMAGAVVDLFTQRNLPT